MINFGNFKYKFPRNDKMNCTFTGINKIPQKSKNNNKNKNSAKKNKTCFALLLCQVSWQLCCVAKIITKKKKKKRKNKI